MSVRTLLAPETLLHPFDTLTNAADVVGRIVASGSFSRPETTQGELQLGFEHAQYWPEGSMREYKEEVFMDGASSVYHYQAPRTLRYETPVLIIPGLSAPHTAYEKLAEHLRLLGFKTITFEQPRWQRPDALLRPEELKDPLLLQSKTVWAINKDVQTRTGEGKLTLVGHSQGGVTAVKAALAHPDNTEVVALVGSAGIDVFDSKLEALNRTGMVLWSEIAKKLHILAENGPNGMGLDVIKHNLANPLRLLREAWYISSHDAVPNIEKLQALGIPVALMAFEEDGFFRHAEVFRRVSHLCLVAMLVPDAHHVHPQHNPFGSALDLRDLLQDVEAKLGQTA